MTSTATPRTDPALLDALREDLAAAPFGVDEVHERLGDLAARALGREQVLPARRAVAGATDPLGVLIGCFGLGLPTSADDLPEPVPTAPAATKAELDADIDSVLDEIDTVLESNAEEFVRGFVQKGGQ